MDEVFGLPKLLNFTGKVRRHETFGFALSMSGFTDDLNDQATRGEVLQAAGLSHRQLVDVLEGLATWTEVALRAHKAAKRYQKFFEP